MKGNHGGMGETDLRMPYTIHGLRDTNRAQCETMEENKGGDTMMNQATNDARDNQKLYTEEFVQ